jgi:large subunit ribosomal protein L24
MSTFKVRLTKELMKARKIISPQLKEAAKKTRWNIVRGDTVQIIQGHPERGKQGIVKKVIRKEDRVIVEGVNLGPKRIKANPDKGTKGLTIMTERTIHYSKVSLVCPVTNEPTRVFRKIMEDGTKVRVAKKSGVIIPKPASLLIFKPKSAIVTKDCTLEADAWEMTWVDPALRSTPTSTDPMDTSA